MESGDQVSKASVKVSATIALTAVALTGCAVSASNRTTDQSAVPTDSPIASQSATPYPSPTPTHYPVKDSLPVTFHVKTKDPVFFITIDDGAFRSKEALELVKKHKLPVTGFLNIAYAVQDWDYFREITSFGGAIQNHTMHHLSLVDPRTDIKDEVCRAQKIFQRHIETRPVWLRPPYGAGGFTFGSTADQRKKIAQISSSCGITHIVMWDSEILHGKLLLRSGSKMKPGDIVLMHFRPELKSDLEVLLREGRKAGLTPAPLEEYLSTTPPKPLPPKSATAVPDASG